MNKKQITLRIDDSGIRVLKTNGVQAVKWAEAFLEEGLVSSGVVMDTRTVAAKLKEVFKTAGLGKAKVAVALSGLNSHSKLITLPRMPEKMIGRYIGEKLARDLSISGDDIRVSWQVVETTADRMRVFVAACLTETMENMIETLRLADLTPVSMDLLPLALAGAAGTADAVIVDAGPADINLAVLSHGIPVVSKSIPQPDSGSSQDDLSFIEKTLKSVLPGLEKAIEKPVLILAGDLTAEPELAESLAGSLGLELAETPGCYTRSGEKVPSEYLANFGLTLKNLPSESTAGSVINLEFLPKKLWPKLSMTGRARQLPVRVIAVAEKIKDRPVRTLHIDDTSLNLLVTRGRKVIRWGSIRLEPGQVQDGVIEDPQAVSEQITELFSVSGVKKGKVIVGVSGLHSLHRTLKFPRLPASELGEAVYRDSQRELPVPLSDLYLSWQSVDSSAEEDKVFSIAYPRKLADGLMEALRLAGIKPLLLDLAPLALARAAGRSTAAVVDVRSAEMDIVILTGGVPNVIRTVQLPGEKSRKEKLTMVRDELRRTLDFFRKNRPAESDLTVFLSGELIEEPDLLLSWSGQLGCTVVFPSPAVEFPEIMPVSSFMTNIGLALKKLNGNNQGSHIVNLNALPDIYREKVIPWRVVLASGSAALAIALLVYGAFITFDKVAAVDQLSASVLETESLVVEQKIEQRTMQRRITSLEEDIAEREISLASLKTAAGMITKEQQILSGDIELANDRFFDPMTLSQMSHADNLIVSGHAENEQEVLDYADELRSSDRFSQVIITRLIEEEGQLVNFTLTLISRR